MGRNAQAATEGALRTGRPVDSYGMAAVLGGGLGGAAAGAANPAVDEQMKREYRLRELEDHITNQLQVERASAQMENDRRELELRRQQIEQTGEIQRLGVIARNRPKGFTLGGRRVDFRWDANANDGEGGYVAFEPEVDGAAVRDASKMTNAEGRTPWQEAQIEEWRAKRKATESEGEKNRQSRKEINQASINARASEGEKNRANQRAIATGHDATSAANAQAGIMSREAIAAANRKAAGRRASIQSLARYAQAKQKTHPGFTLADAVKEAEAFGATVYDEDEQK